MTGGHVFFVGLGSNLGDKVKNIKTAIHTLTDWPDASLCQVSSLYQSDPVGFVKQPSFINAVVKMTSHLPPETILKFLKHVENQLGRDMHGVRFGPRVIDLDLLAYRSIHLHSRTLVLPHPRASQRLFVLMPWVEIAPNYCLPGQLSIARLLVLAKQVLGPACSCYRWNQLSC
jgi:2-amino-4-hydroxy-6-hydroxymethyldihydropteridine diphosphokinase